MTRTTISALSDDPSGKFKRGHVYYMSLMCDYPKVVSKDFQTEGIRFVHFVTAHVFLGTEECWEGNTCKRGYKFQHCLPPSFLEDSSELKIVGFRSLEDSSSSMGTYLETISHSVETETRRRENSRKHSN